MKGTGKQIIGSFEDIGKDVAREAGKVPGDLIGAALESLGTPKSNPKQQQQQNQQSKQPATDERPKVPRQWLEELAGKSKPQKEPTVQERLERQKQEDKRKDAEKAKTAAQMAPIVTGSSKPRRGNLYGIAQKRTAVENKNARQD